MGIHKNAVLTPTGREILVRRVVDEGQRPMSVATDMHAMWSDGTVYDGDAQASDTDLAARAAAKERRLLIFPTPVFPTPDDATLHREFFYCPSRTPEKRHRPGRETHKNN